MLWYLFMYFFQLNLDSPDALNSLGLDNSFSMEDFRENFRVDIVSSNDEELIFDMVGVDASIANALRRIMIAEVIYY
jgi:DNA-directed RNA polymerases I and III subunit RPAC1